MKDNGKKIVAHVAADQELHVNDLVWGKVKSHPWWPGQIFDPSAHSEKAKRYCKRGRLLIAYFGDQSFAWNEASCLKPFQAHFSQLAKQSTGEDFRYAVDCALDEVSRRVAFGLACSCLSEDIRFRIKTQEIVNAGIREECSRRDGGDRFLTAASFNPMKLVEYVKRLGRLPYGTVNRVEHVIVQAQLLALNRWKGYLKLPEFNMLGELLENDAVNLHPVDLNFANADASNVKDEEPPYGMGMLQNQDNFNRKRKCVDSDSLHSNKKEKRLSDLMAGNNSSLSNDETESGKRSGRNSSISGKKSRVADSSSDYLKGKQRKSHLSTRIDDESPQSKRTHRIGDSIVRVASKLNGSDKAIKCGDVTSEKSLFKDRSKQKSETLNKSKIIKRTKTELSFPEKMLPQLYLAAKNPMKGFSFLNYAIAFFVEFRNSVSLYNDSFWNQSMSVEHAPDNENTETCEAENVKDTYWVDVIIQSNPEEPISPADMEVVHSDTVSQKGHSIFEPQALVESSGNLDSGKETFGRDIYLGTEFHHEAASQKGISAFEPDAPLQLSAKLNSEKQTSSGHLDLGMEIHQETTNQKGLSKFEPEALLESNGILDYGKQTSGGNLDLGTELHLETATERGFSTFEPEALLKSGDILDTEKLTSGGDLDLKTGFRLETASHKGLSTIEPETLLMSKTKLESEKRAFGETLDLETGVLSETARQKYLSIFEPKTLVGSSTNIDSEKQTSCGNLDLETMNHTSNFDEIRTEDLSPTSLILNFSNFNSLPSVTYLNQVFSRFGPLDTSRTEVLQKRSRAKVVFKRRTDAETAFSSAGKYSIFGPSLVSYRLKYLPPCKAFREKV